MKEIKITSNGIKQAIDDLVDENERLQDKVYKLEDIIKEVREKIEEANEWVLGVGLKAVLLQLLDKEVD